MEVWIHTFGQFQRLFLSSRQRFSGRETASADMVNYLYRIGQETWMGIAKVRGSEWTIFWGDSPSFLPLKFRSNKTFRSDEKNRIGTRGHDYVDRVLQIKCKQKISYRTVHNRIFERTTVDYHELFQWFRRGIKQV